MRAIEIGALGGGDLVELGAQCAAAVGDEPAW